MGDKPKTAIDSYVLTAREQEQINDEGEKAEIQGLNLNFEETAYEEVPKYLGISSDLWTSYYIGIDWLKVNKKAIAVLPKMNDIDFNKMFVDVLEFDPPADYFSKFYGVSINKPFIYYPQANALLTPLIIIHYLSIMKKLLSHGLVRDYLSKEENLKYKIKGRIVLSRHIIYNVIPHREEFTTCRYQEYTSDIPVNRLLKRALLFSLRAISSLPSNSLIKVQSGIRRCLRYFVNVSNDYDINSVRTFPHNKLHRYYNDAVTLAKMILRRYDNALDNISEISPTPPFWIDMSRLYEVYVYSNLYRLFGEDVHFQVRGHFNTAADFVVASQNLIVDAKYKPRYNFGNSNMIDDIREISGYARDTRITKDFSKGAEPDCLIIYPFTKDDDDSQQYEEGTICNNYPIINLDGKLCDKSTAIPGFRKFYKLAVELPLKSK